MLRTRFLTSVVLVPIFLAALFLLPDVYWSLLMLAAISVGIWEWAEMAKFTPGQRIIYLLVTLVTGVALTFGASAEMAYFQQYGMFWGILTAALFWMILTPIWLISRYHLKNIVLMAAAGWLVILPMWLALVSLRRKCNKLSKK